MPSPQIVTRTQKALMLLETVASNLEAAVNLEYAGEAVDDILTARQWLVEELGLEEWDNA